MTESKQTTLLALSTWILVAFVIGLITGWIRYWIGYYVLLQGIVVGCSISWGVHKIATKQQPILSKAQFKISILLFFSFMMAQAVGFGLAQPRFNSLGWLSRIWEGQTVESVFGIFSTGGVAHHAFAEGLSGGFWLFLSLFDLAFMFFFLLITLPPKTTKSTS